MISMYNTCVYVVAVYIVTQTNQHDSSMYVGDDHTAYTTNDTDMTVAEINCLSMRWLRRKCAYSLFDHGKDLFHMIAERSEGVALDGTFPVESIVGV